LFNLNGIEICKYKFIQYNYLFYYIYFVLSQDYNFYVNKVSDNLNKLQQHVSFNKSLL